MTFHFTRNTLKYIYKLILTHLTSYRSIALTVFYFALPCLVVFSSGFQKEDFTGIPPTTKQQKFYDNMNAPNSRLPSNYESQVRTISQKDQGAVRGSGEHEIFATAKTPVWHALTHGKLISPEHMLAVPQGDKNKSRLSHVNIGGKDFTWLNAQKDVRVRTQEIIFKDGSAHSGALYLQKIGQKGGLFSGQDDFHGGQFLEIMKGSNPLSAAIRGTRYQINNTLSVKEFAEGAAFKTQAINSKKEKKNVEGIFDTYDRNLLDGTERREAAKQYMQNRNKLKNLLLLLKKPNDKEEFKKNNPLVASSAHSQADSATVSALDKEERRGFVKVNNNKHEADFILAHHGTANQDLPVKRERPCGGFKKLSLLELKRKKLENIPEEDERSPNVSDTEGEGKEASDNSDNDSVAISDNSGDESAD